MMKKLFGLRPLLLLIIALALVSSLTINANAAPLNMPDGTVFDPIYYADTYSDLKAASKSVLSFITFTVPTVSVLPVQALPSALPYLS